MKIGKIAADSLEKNILDKINYKRDDVLVHAGLGEDSAVVDFGDQVLVISSDPITGAINEAGYLAVHVACNDLAATGARPIGIQVVLLLPVSSTEEKISNLMSEIEATAADLNVEILGGHTEILSSVSKPLITVTAVGKAARGEYVSTGGARNGDDLVLTKGPGIEGTYILANDFEDVLLARGVKASTLEAARGYKHKLSVLGESSIAVVNDVHAMHDVTEGGLYGALEEMATASGTGFELWLDMLEVTPETKEITDVLGMDPGGLLSSGSMLIAVKDGEYLVKKLVGEGIKAFTVGKIRSDGQYVRDKEKEELREFAWTGRDELWRWLELTK